MRRRGWLALLLTCWAAALPAVAEERRDGSATAGRRVGLSPLAAGDLASEHRYLADALVRLLRERLEGIDGVELVAADAPVGVLPRQVAVAADLDLLIWGQIETVSEHLVLEVNAFDAALVRNVWSYYESGEPDVLLAAIDPVADGLAPLLLGTPWSRLAVDPVPADSSVQLDGVLIGCRRDAPALHRAAPGRVDGVPPGLPRRGPAGGPGAGAGGAGRRRVDAARSGLDAA